MGRARHRLHTPRVVINPMWWLITAVTAACAGLLIVIIAHADSPAAAPQISPAATTILARPDPTVTTEAKAYLAALAAHHVAVEPHQAVNYGGQVCWLREKFNASPFTLQSDLRQQAPRLPAVQVATLVDDAIGALCPPR